MGILASLKLFAVVGVLAGAGFLFNQTTNLKAELAVADGNIITLETAKEQQDAVIESMKQDIVQKTQLAEEMQATIEQQAKDLAALNERFQRSANGNPRDIGNLAIARPQSVQRVINNASAKAARCIELASGATLNEEELKVESKNSECQGLLDTLRTATSP
jgi:tetraacyldisaccharide-1-P 4'-kinase